VSVVKAVELHPLDDPKSALAQRSVFFEYDKYEIAPAGRALIEAHSKYLVAHASASVRLEGNADERGGREYNLALGQKRADAVRQAMKLLGVADKQVESVSFGKEKPLALGHDEESWAKNRRVDVNYQTR
jgi:peptidoglycan-associated lipoprotein